MTKSLQEEIGQTRPFRSHEHEAYLNIIRTAAVLNDEFERVLKPFGITAAQYNVLRILRGAEPLGLCRNEVRDRMLTRMPDMTRLLDRMEKAGLVSRCRDEEDRRLVTTLITERGRELLVRLEPAVAELHERRMGQLTEQDKAALVRQLTQVRDVP